MLKVRTKEVRNHFKEVCEIAFQGEVVVIKRPKKRNVVMIPEEEYREIMLFKKKRMEYVDQLKRKYPQRYSELE